MNLLISEYPLIVLPSLATAIGLNEAIILQQLHYWSGKSKDGWVYNTYDNWKSNFPWWSVATIRRAINKLEAMGLVESRQEPGSFDRKKYYRINYAALDSLPICSKCADQSGQDEQLLTETTTETIKELKDYGDNESPKINKKYVLESVKGVSMTATKKVNNTEHYQFYLKLCELTHNNPDLQLRKVHGMTKKLRNSGYSVEDLDVFKVYWSRDNRWVRDKRPPSVEEVFLDLEKSRVYAPRKEKENSLESMFESEDDIPDILRSDK